MYSMWNAPSDLDYYGQFNPEPPEDEEPEPEDPEIPEELQAHWDAADEGDRQYTMQAEAAGDDAEERWDRAAPAGAGRGIGIQQFAGGGIAMSEKIVFQTNLPVELALQFLQGKPVDSQFGGVQHLFSTIDNRVFFVSEMVGGIIADQLKKLGVQKGEAIEICKAEVTQGRGRKGIQWIVKKVGSPLGEQPDGTFAVQAAPAAPESALERQLRQSIAAANNGKPGTSALTPAPGTATAPNTEQPVNNGNGSKPNGNGAAHNGHSPEHNIHQSWAQFLLGQTNTLIDLYAAALNYAGTKHGNAVKPEDVKTLLTTAFINLSKQGGGHAA